MMKPVPFCLALLAAGLCGESLHFIAVARGAENSGIVETTRRMQAVYASASPTVVRLSCESPRGETPLGCGVIVSEEGLLVTPTAVHERVESKSRWKAHLSDGRTVAVMPLGWSEEWQVGMAKLDAPGPWRHATLAADEELQVGRRCIVLDYPDAPGLGFDPAPSLRFGSVTTLAGKLWFATSCGRVVPGSEQSFGCGVFDLEGTLLGISSALPLHRYPLHTSVTIIRRFWDDLVAGKNVDRERLVPEGRKLAAMSDRKTLAPAGSPLQTDGPVFARPREATVRIRPLGLCDAAVTVHMPGGPLAVEIDAEFCVRMTGPVGKVAEGRLCAEVLPGT